MFRFDNQSTYCVLTGSFIPAGDFLHINTKKENLSPTENGGKQVQARRDQEFGCIDEISKKCKVELFSPTISGLE